MAWSDSEKTIISSLKGRLSKILGAKIKLSKNERITLENIYITVDTMILKDEKEDEDMYRHFLSLELDNLLNSRKNYVKEHILPLVEKISNGRF